MATKAKTYGQLIDEKVKEIRLWEENLKGFPNLQGIKRLELKMDRFVIEQVLDELERGDKA